MTQTDLLYLLLDHVNDIRSHDDQRHEEASHQAYAAAAMVSIVTLFAAHVDRLVLAKKNITEMDGV